jgi:hypothetical protein
VNTGSEESYPESDPTEQSIPKYGKTESTYPEECASYASYPRFSGDGEVPQMPPYCTEGYRPKAPGAGYMAVKRQDDGDSLRNDVGDAVGDIGNRIQGGDDNWSQDGGDDGNDDGDDGRGNAAVGKTIPMLGVASVVAVSFLVLM